MTQQTILDVVSASAAKQRQANERLLKAVEQKAARLARAKEHMRRATVQEALATRRRRLARMHAALQGVASLCALGPTPQFQALIEARGKPLMFWGGEKITSPGYDMSDVHWKWVSRIELTGSELRLENHTETSSNYGMTFTPEWGFAVHLPYGMCEEYLRTRPFWYIATPNAIDEIDLDDPRDCSADDGINFVYSSERLFEILVGCGDPKKFNKLFRSAIKR